MTILMAFVKLISLSFRGINHFLYRTALQLIAHTHSHQKEENTRLRSQEFDLLKQQYLSIEKAFDLETREKNQNSQRIGGRGRERQRGKVIHSSKQLVALQVILPSLHQFSLLMLSIDCYSPQLLTDSLLMWLPNSLQIQLFIATSVSHVSEIEQIILFATFAFKFPL